MPADEFDVLGISPSFDLDRASVERAYLSRATALHPDLATGSDDAARVSAEVNRAKAVLANPESRADVLLRRLGGPGADREKSLPPTFLAAIMEVREELEAGLQDCDAARRVGHVQRWEAWSRDERRRAIEEVGAMFRAVPPSGDVSLPAALRAIRIRLNAWRYIERLIEQLDPSRNPPPTP